MTGNDGNHLDTETADAQPCAFQHFYQTRLGRIARQLIIRKLEGIFDEAHPPQGDPRIAAALGYPRPYLRFLDRNHGAAVGLQSVAPLTDPWPRKRPSRLALVDEAALPVLPSSLDTMLLVHALETSPDPVALLDECWRVLKSHARLVVVVPHRGAMWSGREITPFGYGQPYTINQIRSLLKTAGFDVGKVTQALAAPPSLSFLYPRFAPLIERLPNPLGGVLIVDARKMIYSVRGVPATARRYLRPGLAGMNSTLGVKRTPGVFRADGNNS